MFLIELSGKQKRILNVPALSSDISHSMNDSEKVLDVAKTFNNFFVNKGKSKQDNIQAPSYESKIEDVELFFPNYSWLLRSQKFFDFPRKQIFIGL